MSHRSLGTLLLLFPLVIVGGQIGQSQSATTEWFAKPFRLKTQADGFVDVGDGNGYAGPTLADLDGDGRRDLVVGQFNGGLFRVYRNVGSEERPVYAAHRFLEAENGRASVPIG